MSPGSPLSIGKPTRFDGYLLLLLGPQDWDCFEALRNRPWVLRHAPEGSNCFNERDAFQRLLAAKLEFRKPTDDCFDGKSH